MNPAQTADEVRVEPFFFSALKTRKLLPSLQISPQNGTDRRTEETSRSQSPSCPRQTKGIPSTTTTTTTTPRRSRRRRPLAPFQVPEALPQFLHIQTAPNPSHSLSLSQPQVPRHTRNMLPGLFLRHRSPPSPPPLLPSPHLPRHTQPHLVQRNFFCSLFHYYYYYYY